MKVAILGLGFMGATHAKAWKSVRGATLAGVMSSNPAKLAGDLSTVGGNLGVTFEHADFGEALRFRSVESVLADSAIDAVDICLPTDLHAAVAIAALRAGQHVLLEKPMALDYPSAQSILAAASERTLMVAQVLRFIPAYRRLAEWAQGRKIERAVFRRQCGKPAWLSDISRSGGAVLDLLIHDIDFCISLWGMPESVRATGTGDLIRAELTWPEIGPVAIEGGWHEDPAFPFSMEYDADGFRWSSTDPAPEGAEADPFVEELQYFTDCVTSGAPPDFCPPEQSAQAVALARFMLESRDHNAKLVRTS